MIKELYTPVDPFNPYFNPVYSLSYNLLSNKSAMNRSSGVWALVTNCLIDC